MALNTVSSDRLSTNVKNTNFTSAEKQDLTNDILPLAGQLGNRRLTINGAMTISQRGTSSTSSGYLLDRFNTGAGSIDEAPTYAQVDVASGTTPYSLGFRKALKITNGNQTSGAQAGSYVTIYTPQEAQNIANSGWNYTSSSSNITFSFWVKASVSKTYYFYFKTPDGSAYLYPMETGVLTADTWTKVTKTIPGNSNLTINNDNGVGIEIMFWAYAGTNFTDAGVSLNAWQSYSGSARLPVDGTSWFTTNDATFEITGVQLEVGSVATDFEHRSFAQELALCQRYYYRWTAGATNRYLWQGQSYSTSSCFGVIKEFPVTMRAVPTSTISGTWTPYGDDGSVAGHNAFTTLSIDQNTVHSLATGGWDGGSGIGGGGRCVVVKASAATDYIDASAEL